MVINIASLGTINSFNVRIPDRIPVRLGILQSDQEGSPLPHVLLQKALSAWTFALRVYI